MKAFTIFIVLTSLFVYQKWGDISNYIYPPPDYAELHDVDVIMYGTSWCGYCAKARELLDDLDVSYFEYDIEKSNEGYQQFSDLGGRGVPVLQIGGEVIKGFNPSKIRYYVEKLDLES